MKPYLSIGAIYRNEAPYLREWIEFHRLVGVERLFLYNNESTDDHMEVLAPYVADGTVVREDFPGFPPQLRCYQHCIETHRHDARWIAFIDVDEFLFSPTRRPVPEILREYEEYPGVGVNCLVFGTSGHQTPPAGLVVENYTRRLGLERQRSKVVKAVVDPERVVRVGNSAHYFVYRDGVRAVDERRRPVRGEFSDTPSVELLRINHYFTRSQEERERKLATPRVDNGKPKQREGVEKRDRKLNEEPDDTILGFAPALREALGLEAPAGASTESWS
ncbi:MAG: glycosyltransferase family 92 protein [Solirubrobacterales bacterium]